MSQPVRSTRFVKPSQFFKWVAVIGILAAFLQLQAYIARSSHEVPWADQWATSVPLAIATHEGTLTFADLVAQHNEHRIFFTNLLTVIFTALTDWRIALEPYVNVALASFSYLLLVRIFRRAQVKALPAAALLFALIVFSIRQGNNWYLGFQSCMYFLYFFYVAAVATLYLLPNGAKALILAGVCCFCATFSYGYGFTTWIVLLLCLWLFGYRQIKHFVIWCGMAGITYFLYFTNFSLHNSVSLTSVFSLEFVQSVFSSLGAQFVDVQAGDYDSSSVVFGILGLGFLAVNLWALWRFSRRPRLLAPWLAFAGLALCASALVGYGRADLGLPQTLVPRYVTISHLLWLSSAAMGLLGIAQMRRQKAYTTLRRGFVVFNIAALIVFGGAFVQQTLTTWRLPIPGFKIMEDCMIAYPVTQQTDCLVYLFPLFDPAHSTPEMLQTLYERVLLLARYRLTIYALQTPDVPAASFRAPDSTFAGAHL